MKKKFSLFGHGLLGPVEIAARGKIMGRFTYPPFSILNAREGVWQKRKRAWLALGIKSELGRFESLTWGSEGDAVMGDPQLNFDRNSTGGKPVCGNSVGGLSTDGNAIPYTDSAKRKKGKKSINGGLAVDGQRYNRKKSQVSPGHSPRPAADYGKSHARGDGSGRAIPDAAYTDIGEPVRQYRGKKTFGTTDEQKRYAANSACRPHSGHDPRPGRPRGEDYNGGDAWVSSGDDAQTGTSIFDPVLTELCFRWFTAPGMHVLDPFAGGSVRGIVAALLDRRYTGIELRPEQLESNRAQAETICPGYKPTWVAGDAKNIGNLVRRGEWADFVFSCPPYGDLEIYSDDPRDLSQMTPEKFSETYAKIIRRVCRHLKPDRFACFVVGDYRRKTGYYADFPAETTAAFRAAGLEFYNQMILVTAVGSLPIRIGKQFDSGRKIGMTHQHCLVYCKGNWKKAAAACRGEDG